MTGFRLGNSKATTDVDRLRISKSYCIVTGNTYVFVSVIKTDFTPGKVLTGAIFYLICYSMVIHFMITVTDSVVTFTNIQPETNIVSEQTVPEGTRLAQCAYRR